MTDTNLRIEVAEDGIHVYNRDGHHVAADPFDLFPSSASSRTAHAFYLGVELARAQIAHQLGKRYAQDNELRWGCGRAAAGARTGCTSPRREHAGASARSRAAGRLMPFIRESIVTTLNADGSAYVAPLGVIERAAAARDRPVSAVDDAGQPAPASLRLHQLHHRCPRLRRLRQPPPTRLARGDDGADQRLAPGWRRSPMARSRSREVQRGRAAATLLVPSVHEASHAPFLGLNRAQAAVVEGAILVSRLHHAAAPTRSSASWLSADRDRQDRRRGGA